MKPNFVLKVIIFVTILLTFTNIIFSIDDRFEIYSPNYFNEQNRIYEDIHYLENEYLSFKFCTDEKSEKINFNLVCNEQTVSIEVKKYEDTTKGCYYSNYNLKDINCNDFSLEIGYELDNKEKQIKRTFKKQKQSKLINYVLSEDYKTLNPTDLSYYLLVQSDLETINSKKSTEIYDVLKNSRNNENKCWTGSSCSLISSSLILKNILITGYNLNSRLLEDGKNYLERKILNNNKNPIKIIMVLEDDYAFSNSSEVSCEVSVDSDNSRIYTFDNESLNLSKQVSEKLIVTCNQSIENIELNIYNLQGNLSKIIENENTNSVTYNIDKFSCLGESNNCDFTNSLYALITYGSQIQDSSLIDNYLSSYLVEDFDGQVYLNTGDRKYEDMGKYLYYKSNPNMLEYLKFKQNNDGSWGLQSSIYDRVIQTSWSVLGLQKVQSSSEYVQDGKKWIYYNEPIGGWGTIEKNTLAYMAIKEQIKPYLKINIQNSITDTTSFTIENPTIYELKNIKIKFTDKINKHLSYSENLGELYGQENISFNITLNANFFGKMTGEMIITGIDGKGRELNLIKLPITIESQVPFNLNNKPYVISEDFKNIELEIINNKLEFEANCTYKNPFNNNLESIQINHLTKNILIVNNELKAGEFEINMKCNIQNSEFEFSTNINVALSEKNFEIETTSIKITNTKDFQIKLTNTNLEKQVISLEILGDYIGIIEPTEKTKIIAKDETRDIYFTIINPTLLEALGNTSKGEILIKAENGYIKKIPITVEISSEDKTGFKFNWIYIVLSIFVLFVITILILRYKRQKENEEEENSSLNGSDSNEEIYI